MCQKYTPDELNSMDHDAKNEVICQMQDRLDKLEHDYGNLIEQIRLADQQRYGRHTESLDAITGQLSFFNEAEACYDAQHPEPGVDEVIEDALKKPRKPKKKGTARGRFKGLSPGRNPPRCIKGKIDSYIWRRQL